MGGSAATLCLFHRSLTLCRSPPPKPAGLSSAGGGALLRWGRTTLRRQRPEVFLFHPEGRCQSAGTRLMEKKGRVCYCPSVYLSVSAVSLCSLNAINVIILRNAATRYCSPTLNTHSTKEKKLGEQRLETQTNIQFGWQHYAIPLIRTQEKLTSRPLS